MVHKAIEITDRAIAASSFAMLFKLSGQVWREGSRGLGDVTPRESIHVDVSDRLGLERPKLWPLGSGR